MMMVKAYHKQRGETQRNIVVIPDSAHGTNPASAARCGFKVKGIPSNRRGCTDLDALAKALREIGDVTIVAPVLEASAIGHALTLRHPLRVESIDARVFAVDGTPTDCVNVAVAHILKQLPDLIVSGINKGWNLGDDVTYSGTVAGAQVDPASASMASPARGTPPRNRAHCRFSDPRSA